MNYNKLNALAFETLRKFQNNRPSSESKSLISTRLHY